jgi:hypothetical protein
LAAAFGEYLARIFGRTMDKPTYVLRETTPEAAERFEGQVAKGQTL